KAGALLLPPIWVADGTCHFDKSDRSIFLKFRRTPGGHRARGLPPARPGAARGNRQKGGPVMLFRNAFSRHPHAITTARPWLLAGNPHATERPE
ncbi:MAG: hypothetical protein ABWY92_17205, partial [Xanthobacteraceae bacterium]